jgi:hypothetical protein
MFVQSEMLNGLALCGGLLLCLPWLKQDAKEPSEWEKQLGAIPSTKMVWNLRLVNGRKYDSCRVLHADSEGLVIWYKQWNVAVPQDAVAWLNLSMRIAEEIGEPPLRAQEEEALQQVSSWRGFVESLKGKTVSLSTVEDAALKQWGLVLRDIVGDVLFFVHPSEVQNPQPLMVPVHGLCSIGQESYPPQP